MKIRCLYDKLVPVELLKPHPQNPAIHSKSQIKKLAKILDYQGWRYPIKVSIQSNLITSGHGRLQAAKLNKWNEVPVNYQNYDTPDQELADLIADNSINEETLIDMSIVNSIVPDLGPDFDVEMLAIKDFEIEPADRMKEEKPKCPTCGK
jgi:ParB-like chromosome segregation protein Spo0J